MGICSGNARIAGSNQKNRWIRVRVQYNVVLSYLRTFVVRKYFRIFFLKYVWSLRGRIFASCQSLCSRRVVVVARSIIILPPRRERAPPPVVHDGLLHHGRRRPREDDEQQVLHRPRQAARRARCVPDPSSATSDIFRPSRVRRRIAFFARWDWSFERSTGPNRSALPPPRRGRRAGRVARDPTQPSSVHPSLPPSVSPSYARSRAARRGEALARRAPRPPRGRAATRDRPRRPEQLHHRHPRRPALGPARYRALARGARSHEGGARRQPEPFPRVAGRSRREQRRVLYHTGPHTTAMAW